MEENLLYDSPGSQGVSNAIRRAYQLRSIRWSPLLKFSSTPKEYLYPARTGEPHTSPASYDGLPYSSCRVIDKFIGLDVSIDTFLTALNNPASILYTRNLSDFRDEAFHCAISNTFLVYGIVCSAFVCYVLGLPLHRSTHEWDSVPEFFKAPEQTADSLKLCDILITTRADGRTGGHVRIVTGIARDTQGHVVKAEVAEEWQPTDKFRWYSASEINAMLVDPADHYRIFRYRFLDSIPYTPTRHELGYQPSPSLMLNYGDFSNYEEGETVEFYIPAPADTLVIKGEHNHLTHDLTEQPLTTVSDLSHPLLAISNLKPDRYIAYVIRDGKASLPVHFIVAALPQVQITHTDGQAFSRIRLTPVSPDGNPLTRKSPCLYQEDGQLNPQTITIAFSDGQHLIPAKAAVREINGQLILRTAALLTDVNGTPVRSFCLEEIPPLYAYSAEEGTLCQVSFSQAQCCTPTLLCWKEENFISYQQRLFTSQEQKEGRAITPLLQHDNPFAHFCLSSQTEYGRLVGQPILFIICPRKD